MRFSVVINTYNRADALRQTLLSLRQQNKAPTEQVLDRVERNVRGGRPVGLPQFHSRHQTNPANLNPKVSWKILRPQFP